MADVPSTGDAAINLRDDNRRVSRERHKRLLESALDSSKVFCFPKDTSTVDEFYQCLNVLDNVTSAGQIKSCNKSSNNQKVIVLVEEEEDSLSFTPSSDNDDCQDVATNDDNDSNLQLDNKEDGEDGDDVVVNNRHANGVESTTLLTSWTLTSDSKNVDGSRVTLGLGESKVRSERVRERSAVKSMGKSVCIKSNKKKIEKMISAIVRSESREVAKEKQEDVAKDKKGLSQGRVVTTRLQDTSFKKQIKSSEDTLVGPCGKKRCADRYDSSESSDR